MANYNITMKQLNSSGTYDTLYPATIGSQVTGITGDQISGIYTANQTLTSTTKTLYGLGEDAVPDDVLAKIRSLISGTEGLVNTKARIVYGTYVGNGQYGIVYPNSVTFESTPDLFCVLSYKASNSNYRYGMYGSSFELPKTMPSSFTQTRGVSTGNAGVYDMECYGKYQNNKITWYNETDAESQLNYSGAIYSYIAVWFGGE